MLKKILQIAAVLVLSNTVGHSAVREMQPPHIIVDITYLTQLSPSINTGISNIESYSTPEDALLADGQYYIVIDNEGAGWYIEKEVFENYLINGFEQPSGHEMITTSRPIPAAKAA